MVVRMCDATRHPTIIRLKTSVRKQTYATPAHVGTKVKSVTHNALGPVAANFRFTKSGCRGTPGSALVVRTRLPRRTPSIPAARISRPT
jgi:hypothetical protein